MSLALTRIDLTDALAVWRRNFRVYLRLWKTEIVAPVIEPIFTFFAFGFGVGALITSKVEGLSYLSFVGAGILAFTVLMRTVFEMTYAVYFRMVYQSTYDAILATPVNAESLAFGEILWAVTKGLVDCFFIIPLIVMFGAATSLLTPLAVLPLVLGCLFLAGLSFTVTTHVFDIDNFNIYFGLFFSSLFLCGSMFPVSSLPGGLQVLAYIFPVTSVVDLTRACLNGIFAGRHFVEIIYLIVVSIFFVETSVRSLRKRMVV